MTEKALEEKVDEIKIFSLLEIEDLEQKLGLSDLCSKQRAVLHDALQARRYEINVMQGAEVVESDFEVS